MGLGHEIDGNTVAVWRCNTVTAAGLVGPTVDDSGNGWDLDQGVSSARTFIQGAIGGVTLGNDSLGAEVVDDADLCAWIPANGSTYLINTNPGTGFANNILGSTWTFEAWIYIESFDHGSRQIAFRFANLTGGSGSANNEIQIWIDNSTGELTFFWQHDSKVNEQVDQSSGSGVAVRTWTHIAVTCEINVLDWDVTLYIDGVEVGSGTAEAPAVGEYSAADIVVGRDFNNGNRFHGGIGSIACSDVARTPSAIAAAAASGDTRVTPDGNHFALLNFQEEPQVYDHGANGLHLVSATDTTNPNDPGIFGILPDAGLGHYFPSTGVAYKAPKRHHFVNAFQGAAGWTFEAWHRLPPNSSPTADVGLLSYGTDPGETQPTNFLIASYIDRGAANVPNIFWEHSAGTNVLATGSTGWWASTLVDETSLKHLAIVKRSIGGGQSDVEYYRDGTLVDTMSALDDPDGGDDEGALFFVFGNEVTGTATPGAEMHGFADDIRLSNVARSQPDIQASFEAGVTAGSGSNDTTPPTFVVVSPPEGTPISPDTVITVDIEDNVAIALAPLYAEFPNVPHAEMVYNGTSLLAPYAALSTVLDLGDGGRRLALRRSGGWPGAVSLTSIATDTGGNEVA